MKKLFHKICQNQDLLLFILLFAYAQSVYLRIVVREEVNVYTFTPESALATLVSVSILFLIIRFFIRYWQKSAFFSTKEMLKIFASSLIVYILIIQANGFGLAFVFGNIERNFNQKTFTLSTLTTLLNGFIYGSFFLVYYFHKKNKTHQQQLATYNQALSESRINQLKTQLNPHFLFNNLNVLDQLIEEDKHKASDFLNEFSEIYRYVLQASDKKLISITEELVFAEQYFKLIQHKYGNAYQLTMENKGNNGLIVPLTLQLLIENAVQHNLGTADSPVCIKIALAKNLHVSNNCNPKRNAKPVSGRALNNLKEQYNLLAGQPIEIQKSKDEFSVIIPIIQPQ